MYKRLMMNDQTDIPPLCDVCQTLDLWKTNNREVAKYSLGTWEDVKRKAEMDPRCPFCAMIRSFSNRFFQGWYETGEASIEWMAKGGFFFNTQGDNLAFLNEDTATSPYGSTRPVQLVIDHALFKKWLKLCEVHHEKTCTPKSSFIKTAESKAGVKVLRVIDTEDHCIVKAAPGIRYIALSYVWGQVVSSIRLQRDNVTELSTKGALLSLRQEFPRSIKDAIDLVQVMGERYLWIDSLCLIQDEDDDMLDGISHMNLVYQCAIMTIIVAHAVDANTPLSGLHPGSRTVDQEIIEVLPGIKMAATTGVYNAISWWGAHRTRGWTMQELVLSPRLLVFSKYRIYFRCRANCWSEDTIYDNYPSAVNEILHSGTQIRFLSDNEPEPLPAFNAQLFRYAGRKLTKESDMIHGMTGILQVLSVQTRSGVLQGMFTAFFDISVLCWNNFPLSFTAGRRAGFPTWSWAGWVGIGAGYGTACKSPEIVNPWLQTMTYIVWYKHSPGTTKLELVWDLDSQLEYGKPEKHHIGYRPTPNDPYGRMTTDWSLDGLKTRPDDEDAHRAEVIREELFKRDYHLLHFFAHVVLVQGFTDPPEGTYGQVYGILGAGGAVCGEIKFDDPKLMDDGKAQGPHELILLSKLDRYDNFFNHMTTYERPFYWVMLIVWVGEEKVVAERRGIGFFFQDCMEHVLHPGKVWTEIVLA
ncbi:hypothetical protein GALMADRAFT_230334 [Galerina marginata CBS 339.88]|uniref:Heterokaryon incompatibility domain-containing protein n=1 Tax=Galerina marginata (strain CBS 339.88) TaxID=685588 RepID=A0A067SGJ7_GALM3|nr:hypothetical protein GALMADRAFT_230334 [Galerina marginata CBS 339.88]